MSITYTVGAPTRCVISSAARSRSAAAASKRGIRTTVPATAVMAQTWAIRPVTWTSGTTTSERSPSRRPYTRSKVTQECTTFPCVATAPFGRPVVPDV